MWVLPIPFVLKVLQSMPTIAKAAEFLELARDTQIVDVRSPSEFADGHIPSAVNIPLFDDQQRHEVGLLYAEAGHDEAVLKGLEFFGPRMRELAEQARKTAGVSGKLLVHCWRGGMRSSAMAWLFEQTSIETHLLEGGYKAYRTFVHETFARPYGKLIVLSGLTGAGKTKILKQLDQHGEQVIDLEGLANHRGSAFGGIGQPKQPSVEHFENKLAERLLCLDANQRIWLEDESRKIGRATMPTPFFDQFRAAPAVFIEVDRNDRLDNIMEDYAQLDREELKLATERITKRLGGQNVKAVVELIDQGKIRGAFDILLDYYDRSYNLAKSKQNRCSEVNVPIQGPLESACKPLVDAAEKLRSVV